MSEPTEADYRLATQHTEAVQAVRVAQHYLQSAWLEYQTQIDALQRDVQTAQRKLARIAPAYRELQHRLRIDPSTDLDIVEDEEE